MENSSLPLVSAFRIKVIFILIVSCMALIYHIGIAKGAYNVNTVDTDKYSLTELKVLVGECKSQVRVINQQIHDTQKNLDWLVLKISHISDSGRNVSYLLTDSVRQKKEKIFLLENRKERLEKALAIYQKAYDIRKETDTHTDIWVSDAAKGKSGIKEPNKSIVQAKLSDIERAIKKADLEDWVEALGGDGGCAKINNTLPILFSSGSAALAGEYKLFLKKLSQFLKPYDIKIFVNGFADSDPIHTQKYPSNFELGASRAANVVHEMVKNGLKPDIFKIGTTGEYQFAAKTPSSKKIFQRRVQLTIVFSS